MFLTTMHWLWTTLRKLSGRNLRPLSTTRIEIIDTPLKVDEEQLEHYKPGRFYPIFLRDTFASRYQVLSKLGYGSCSTVWLSRDLIEQKYVALKVCISNYPSIEREHAAYAHLREVLRTHSGTLGSSLVRSSLADFELPGVEGLHRCFVFEPLTIDLVATRAVLHFDETLFKTVSYHVFRALEFLHTKAQMIHCDIRAENFCLTALDETTFQRLESLESVRPSPQKIYSDRVIYDGVGQVIPEDKRLFGIPVLCDFGEANFGQEYYEGPIQPFTYQAPEVVFEIPWSYPVDIWNAGIMLWELLEDKKLLSAVYEGQPSNSQLVAEMIALIGKPPPAFILRSPSEVRRRWINDAGEWSCVHPEIKLPHIKLEEEEKVLKDAGVDNTSFLQFIKRILVWEPEKRATASELLADPWLASVIPSSKLL